ncbi:hypothetical protein [Actinoplanes xinjiangensis]|uniref:hypothetical protein n=1 Tax=Actinoplanes xinjiangensis TaxID=512350 RepID=UPI0011B548BF|nr:hypothetical protein [Actinoplanes xinjiangensis]
MGLLLCVGAGGCTSDSTEPRPDGGVAPTSTTAPEAQTGSPTTMPVVGEPLNAETIDPVGDYTRAYQDERLIAESPGCPDNGNFTIGIDFDRPQIGAGTEDAVYSGCGPGTIQSDLRQAEVSGPAATPIECLEKIRTQPTHSPITAVKGLTLCFETDARQAEREAQTQKIVFMTVTKVSIANNRGKLHFTLTAWNVP